MFNSSDILALALYAVKSKPAHQSCYSRLLQLIDTFPADSSSTLSWKSHALSLENELNKVTQTCNAQQIQLDVLKKQPENATAKQSKPSKCVAKAEIVFKQATSQLQRLVQGISSGVPTLPRIPDALVSSLDSLYRLAQINPSAVSPDSVQTCALNLISCVSHSLNSTCSSKETSTNATKSPPPHILDQILSHGLHTCLSLFHTLSTRHKYKKSVIDAWYDPICAATLQGILVPAIRALPQLSLARLKSIFAVPSHSALSVNTAETDLLELVCNVLATLVQHSQRAGIALVIFVILETTRQLDLITKVSFFQESQNDTTMREKEKRLQTLARKDCLWSLCQLVHRCLALSPKLFVTDNDDVVRERALGILAGILWPKNGDGDEQRECDAVCRMMLVTLAEKIIVH